MYGHVHSNIIHNRKKWKQHKCPSTGEWINKMWATHIMEYDSGMKKEPLLNIFTDNMDAWMHLKNILSEWSQTQHFTCYMTPFIWNIQIRQIYWGGKQISISGFLELDGGATTDGKLAGGIFWRWQKCPKIGMWQWWHNCINSLKNHWIVHFLWVYFMVCKLYVHKAVEKLQQNVIGLKIIRMIPLDINPNIPFLTDVPHQWGRGD